MTVPIGGRGNVRVRTFSETLNIRVFWRRRFRSGPSSQGAFGIYQLRGSVHVRTEAPSRQTSPAADLDRGEMTMQMPITDGRESPHRSPWNKGKRIGSKPPLRTKDVPRYRSGRCSGHR
jgi:hypothetical protein